MTIQGVNGEPVAVTPKAVPWSARSVRDANARAVLDHIWSAEDAQDADDESPAVTATDLIGATGLSRATVHDVCDELLGAGWLDEQRTPEPGRGQGRPPRRYRLAASAGIVVGVDAGEHRVAAHVVDLRGRPVAPAVSVRRRPLDAEDRVRIVAECVERALAPVPLSPLAVAVGVPAPVGEDSRTAFRGNSYWEVMNPHLAERLAERGWRTVVDNDANLAALAEHWTGHARGSRHSVTLLAGERFGAGVLEGGRVLRGAHGGVGEMRVLDIVAGVGRPDGIAKVLREELVAAGRRDPDVEAVLRAAAAGDPDALAATAGVADRLSRVLATLTSLFDTDLVIVAGAVAGSATSVVERAAENLSRFLDPPLPRVVTSDLGPDVVALGAVKRALDLVRAHALQLRLSPPRVTTG
ncbi:ROK family transcriptional regulator [Kineococcus gynurae]|uniref:ROK family transcriptional regulator n=1 Tax=Kineococcus gynurae TaxID=452979 RepID=A0ABV5LUQ8_9ACTN